MFETLGMENIALIAFLLLVVIGGSIWGIATYRKKRHWRELEESGEFTATYDDFPNSKSTD
jgi:hypothetical protein